MTIADILLMRVMTEGIKVSAMRELMNSISDSCHSLFSMEIERLGLEGFDIQSTAIYHKDGGEIQYKGLSRNPEAIKSMAGFDVFWLEESSTLSKRSLDLVIPTLRDEGSELWASFNPNSSADPVSQEFIIPFQHELMKDGAYFDELYTIIKCNYDDNPFFPETLELLRRKHKETKSLAEYDHIWNGAFMDEIANSVIKPEWFDACVDAHKIPRLEKAFEPHGAKIASHDPSDTGNDAKGYSLRHGSILRKVMAKDDGEVDEGCDWATGQAINDGADWFVWDGDGLGGGLKRQVSDAFAGTKIQYHMFRGSLSGKGQDHAEEIYMPLNDDKDAQPKTYAETFKNNRSQYTITFADRCYNTYRCVVREEYVDPDDMISFDSEGIPEMQRFRSEVCRIPRKPNGTGLIQIMSKQDMKLLGIESPNMFDSVMMGQYMPPLKKAWGQLNYGKMSIA